MFLTYVRMALEGNYTLVTTLHYATLYACAGKEACSLKETVLPVWRVRCALLRHLLRF